MNDESKQLYGVSQGGDRKSKGDNLPLKKDICTNQQQMEIRLR